MKISTYKHFVLSSVCRHAILMHTLTVINRLQFYSTFGSCQQPFNTSVYGLHMKSGMAIGADAGYE